MKVDVEKLKAIAVKHGVPALEEILIELAFPLLEQAVAESENKLDDAILPVAEPLLKSAVYTLLGKLKE